MRLQNVTVEGDFVVGPGRLAVKLEEQHKVGANRFVLNRERSDGPILWDCVAGIGKTQADVIAMAVETWSTSTAASVSKCSLRTGGLPLTSATTIPDGCHGWHIIHSAVTLLGKGTAAKDLQEWLVNTPLLPTLGPMVAAAFERPMRNGAKVLLRHARRMGQRFESMAFAMNQRVAGCSTCSGRD